MSSFAYVSSRRIRPSKNSSSSLSLYDSFSFKFFRDFRCFILTLYLSEAFSAYPRSTKVCLDGADSSIVFARHLKASRDVSQWVSSSSASMHNVRIPFRERNLSDPRCKRAAREAYLDSIYRIAAV